jgi:hypothetical protein
MGELGSGGGTSYPGTLDTDNTLEVNSPNAGKTKARAECINDANAAIVALETELGTDPAGTLTDVKTFLQTEHNTDGTHNIGPGPMAVAANFDSLVIGAVTDETVDVDATSCIMYTTGALGLKFGTVNLQLDNTASGALGLDTGSVAADTWYHIWVIGKTDGTISGVLSTSAAIGSITFPSGYTYAAYAGAILTDATSDFIAIEQVGSRVVQAQIQELSSGSATSYTEVDLATSVPTTAKSAQGWAYISDDGGANPSAELASNSSGLGVIQVTITASGVSGTYVGSQFDILLITGSPSIYYQVGDAADDLDLYVSGWRFCA